MGTSVKKERARDKTRRTKALGSWGGVKKRKRARDRMGRTKALGSWGRVEKKDEREIKRGGVRLSVVRDK